MVLSSPESEMLRERVYRLTSPGVNCIYSMQSTNIVLVLVIVLVIDAITIEVEPGNDDSTYPESSTPNSLLPTLSYHEYNILHHEE